MAAGPGSAYPRHSLGLPPVVPGLKIGLLGGSFDPPHEGHLHVTGWAFRRLGLNQVWWLVAPRNPLKDRRPASIGRRVHAARQFITHPRVAITDLETRIGSGHTAVTLEFLRKKFPDLRFVWLMGSDNMEGFEKWRRWKEIVRRTPLAVFPRPGHRVSVTNRPMARLASGNRMMSECSRMLAATDPPAWTLLSAPLCSRSSTAIRNTGSWKGDYSE